MEGWKKKVCLLPSRSTSSAAETDLLALAIKEVFIAFYSCLPFRTNTNVRKCAGFYCFLCFTMRIVYSIHIICICVTNGIAQGSPKVQSGRQRESSLLKTDKMQGILLDFPRQSLHLGRNPPAHPHPFTSKQNALDLDPINQQAVEPTNAVSQNNYPWIPHGNGSTHKASLSSAWTTTDLQFRI